MNIDRLERHVARFALSVLLVIVAVMLCCRVSGGEVSAALVQAVRDVESPTGKTGDNGRARSHWQIHRAAWTDVSRERRQSGLKVYTWELGTQNEFVSKVYARTYLWQISDRISTRLGRPARAREIYVAYNWGVTRFSKVGFNFNKAPAIVRARAQRVENMTHE